jgi:hypothetical protein
MNRTRFVTASGRAINVELVDRSTPSGRDALQLTFSASADGSPRKRVVVSFPAFELTVADLAHNGVAPLDDPALVLGILAILRSIEGSEPTDAGRSPNIEIEGDEAVAILARARASDREIRRFVARRMYDVYSRGDLDSKSLFDSYDYALLGGSSADFKRNFQVLSAEGYLTVDGTRFLKDGLTNEIIAMPTAKLIRDVERYGAAKEDVISDHDYASVLAAYPQIGADIEALIAEHRRFALASTGVELMSVFRAASPIVEALAKRVLAASGSTRMHPTLGPVIAELQERALGGPALWSQLNHILKFARDLTLHGSSLPEPVLRIACENAFALAPQLASLLPR